MRNKDTIALSEAYQLVEESRFKSAIAAAAMGLGSMAGHGQTMDDMADRANPHLPEVSQPFQQDQETNYHKALMAFEKAKREKIADNETLNKIALDQDIAKRYALYLVTFGKKIPQIIKNATGKYSNEIERDFNSGVKN